MFNVKNLSPKKLSAFTALILSIPISLGIYLLEGQWLIGVIAFAVIFLGSYFLIFSIIQNFIYRKIKLIYKFINQTKATKREETYYKYILPQKSIDEVREDVEAWAKQQSREVNILKRNETYRREFLQNLSHEFKTPVFAIQGYIDTLLNGALENPEVNRRFLEKAGKNAERLTNLIQDLDAISKLERGELKLSPQNFVIQDVIREAFESLSIKAEEADIDFSFKKGCERPMIVYADKEKIQQVVSNLIDNAIKYGKSGGHIVASVYNTDEKNILVEISDNGIGIPEKYLNRIFERFYRTAGGRNKDVKGSGLGLSICKHIIEAHGHTIHVRSKEDVGTTIGFTLDRKKE
ncbi:sensor histidine kinase [Flavisolibacter ginsenosidimutans]|uniref:histidine kinase n=1 Tax=Flavisolibacter ginsenosidimutans TaxID=661481 RepID=A0A5B8UMK7_9BACT|nr:ATP-binding protein [Flavisolibacter ginsenosidimutans]QEC57808.1 sensor histidine kinase [Flavisolibacter ginsenosidimutans]